MRWYIVVPLALTLVMISALPILANSTQQVATDPSEALLVEAILAYEHALEVGNVEQMMTLFAEDARAFPDNVPPLAGKAAIEEYYECQCDEYTIRRDFELVELEMSDGYATRLGEWTNTILPKDGGDPFEEVGRCIFGYKLVDGKWLIDWQIWNTYEPVVVGPGLPPVLLRDGSPC